MLRHLQGGGRILHQAEKKNWYVCAVPPGSNFFFCSPGRVKIPLFHFFVTLIFLFLFSPFFCISRWLFNPGLMEEVGLLEMIYRTDRGCLGTLFNVYCISFSYKKKPQKKAIPPPGWDCFGATRNGANISNFFFGLRLAS